MLNLNLLIISCNGLRTIHSGIWSTSKDAMAVEQFLFCEDADNKELRLVKVPTALQETQQSVSLFLSVCYHEMPKLACGLGLPKAYSSPNIKTTALDLW